MTASDLRVQNMDNPLGIQEQPVFSYRLSSEGENKYQSAMRILAADSEELLEKNIGNLWDSGKQAEECCFDIRYQGQPIASRQKVYWKVKVWDSEGRESEWSKTAFFETGLLHPQDWKGEWIGQGEAEQKDAGSECQSAAPVFAADFEIEDRNEIAAVRAYVSGLGIFLARVNGKQLSDTFFEPGESDATKSVYYVTYDLEPFVKEGTNTISVELGNGQYTGYTIDPVMLKPDGTRAKEGRYQKNDSCFVKPGLCGQKKLIAQIDAIYRDGRVKTVCATNADRDQLGDWRFVNGPTVFQNWYGGEDYDACREELCFGESASDRVNWKRAKKADPPKGRLVSRECPPIRIQESSPAVSIIKIEDGHFLADMGKNGAGIIELRLSGMTQKERGQWIRIYPAEVLNDEGTGVDQRSCTQSWSRRYNCVIRDSYRIKGAGEERWHPSFCYHGFRYAEITGFPGELKKEQIICHRLFADNERCGSFSCSDETVNRICAMTDRSIESNMYWSFTDCPQIEKLGWIETSHLMFRSVASVYDIRAWMKKIIRDIRDSQLDKEQAAIPGNEEEGFVPGIIPEFYRIGGLYRDPNWNGACVFTPWEYYQYYGDTSVLEQMFPVMERYLAYLERQTKDGVLESEYAQMGEWGEFGEHTPKVLVSTCAYYRMLRIAQQTAQLLKEERKAEFYREKAQQVREAFYRHPECCNPSSGQFGSGSQASWGIVLFSGLAQGSRKKQAVDGLVRAVEQDGYHLTSGEVGLRQVFAALSQNGRKDVVYRMVMNPTSPSYRFFADHGLTTLPEYWNYEELWHGMVRSRNHAMMGHVREWLTAYLLGVRSEAAGWRQAIIEPYPAPGIQQAEGSVPTPWGKISVSWQQYSDRLILKASIPPGITAEIRMPEEYGGHVWKSGSGRYVWEGTSAGKAE